jgi:hypothetical protein
MLSVISPLSTCLGQARIISVCASLDRFGTYHSQQIDDIQTDFSGPNDSLCEPHIL